MSPSKQGQKLQSWSVRDMSCQSAAAVHQCSALHAPSEAVTTLQRANAAQVKEMLSLTEKIVWQPEMDDSPSFIGSPAWDECMEKLVKNRGITQLLFYLSDAAIAQVS